MEEMSYNEALNSPQFIEWERAMQDEFKRTSYWNIVRQPASAYIIGSKWVNSIKRDEKRYNRSIQSLTCCQKVPQTPGRDYNLTYDPIINNSSLRVFCAHINELDYRIGAKLCKYRFLHGELKERMYMAIPKGLAVDEKRDFACQLDKALYGLERLAAQRDIKDVIDRFRQVKAKSSMNPCEVATKLQQGKEDDGLDTLTYPYPS
ncbi:hypothetical protein CCR75_008018 [Bremia lactucae]|uniref:Reverse transcriptase Ty1/copia-type domain-containing protein n=1 Tax=Bremia lactucae TaxID=4779 RepID=A0A976FEW4_BRELC|nr:hypothetical protein CCR75_008018 [Bremia lactucae]